MNDGKYIIKKIRGHEAAVLFHPLLNHCDIGTCKNSHGETVSAGFFRVDGESDDFDMPVISVYAYGHSVSLSAASRGEIDAKLIKKVLEGDVT